MGQTGQVGSASGQTARKAQLGLTPCRERQYARPIRVVTSLETLRGDHEEALHAVAPELRESAREELALLERHGSMLQNGMDPGMHNLAHHHQLLDTLRSASINSASDATSAEQRAGAAAIASLLLIGFLMAWAQRPRIREQSAAVTATAYRTAADRFGVLLEQSPDATAVLAEDGTVIYASESMATLLDSPPKQLADFAVLANDAERDALMEHLNTRDQVRAALDVHSDRECVADEVPREFRVLVTDLMDDPVVHGNLVSVSETTVANRARRQLEYLAGHDQLTGLPNRRTMIEVLGESAAAALLMIDLDDFKQTNDTLGHAAGDELLVAVARRFESCLGSAGTLFRLGGDEFAVIPDKSVHDATALAEELLASLDEPVKLSIGFERASASVGIAYASAGSPNLSLLQRADIALYEAKRDGGRLVRTIDQELEQDVVECADISRALETTSFDAEFELAFQPIVDARTHEPHLIEALCRWNSPAHGPVRPDQFIPMAEASGRIVELGDWVLDQALGTLAALRSSGLPDNVQVSVNVSPFQIVDEAYVARVTELLDRHGLEPEALTIELTESALVTNDERILTQLREVRGLGCSVACDDFGSGYSNLGQLMMLPLNLIKASRARSCRPSRRSVMPCRHRSSPRALRPRSRPARCVTPTSRCCRVTTSAVR